MSVLSKKRVALLAAAALGLLAGPAFGQSDQVETVVVTGAKLPDPVGNAAFSVVNLDQNQLAQFNQLDASLEQVPGLSLFRRSTSLNSNPTTEGVSLRSIAPSGAGRALVLLDGVPLNDPFGNWVIWGALPYESIGSAEVVRGAGAGPYGAGALTGTILLSERDFTDGISEADASAGNLGTYRVGASGGTEIGKVELFGSADGERSNGWIPVLASQRGLADTHDWLDDGAATLRAQTQIDDVTATARVSYYDQAQGAGLEGAEAKARGETASLTLAKPATSGDIGWRVQGWAIDSNLSNTSVSLTNGQNTATPANDQYAIPALGLGFNAALLGSSGHFRWEAGGDLRDDSGESREDYSWNGTKFTLGRRSGGQLLVAGIYGEGAYDTGTWLFTAGVRADYWANTQGHLVQSVLATGAVTLANDYPGTSGKVPTARLGARYNFDDQYLRVAAYAGFRPPSLNELYRPFRVGNVVTSANAGLVPEELYGVEAGWGGAIDSFSWNTTGFINQLHNAVENVTTSSSPTLTLQQRNNVGDINALGIEADASEKLTDTLSLQAALSLTDARVAPQAGQIAAHPLLAGLTGKRPAEAPPVTITAGALWQPLEKLTLGANVHWDSARFEDDLNTIRLGSAFSLDLRAEYMVREHISVFADVDNLTNANIATAHTTSVVNYGEPRVYEVGLRYSE